MANFVLNAGPVEVPEATAGATGPTCTLPGVLAGDIIVVGCYIRSAGSVDVSSITCSGESNLTLLTRQSNGGNTEVRMAYLLNVTTGGTKTITLTITSGIGFARGFWAASFTPSGSAAFDKQNTASGTGTAPTLSITSVGDNALIIGQVHNNDTTENTVGTGLSYTLIPLTELSSPSFQRAAGEYIADGGAAGNKTVDFGTSVTTWALAGASFILDLNVSRTPTVGSLTLTGVAPTSINSNTNRTPIVGALALSGVASTLGFTVTVIPSVGVLALTGTVPGIISGPMAQPSTGVLSFTGIAPSVSQSNYDIRPVVGALALTGVVPGILAISENMPTVGALVMTGAAPGITLGGVSTFSALTATGTNEPSTLGAGIAIFERLTATGSTVENVLASGSGTFEALTAFGNGPIVGEGVFERLTASGFNAGAVTGAASFQPLAVVSQSGNPVFEALRATGTASAAQSTEYSAFVMNTRSTAITEYTNYEFNSFAKIGDSYYGAGPAGLVRLDGARDDSANIDWSFRTGQLDDKDPGLKRLPEVLCGLRSSGPVRVRVWYSDTGYYDYVLPPVKLNTIHQHRVKVGRGMRSRWFAVELQGVSNSTIELDNIQVNFAKTSRRLG